MGDPVIEMRKKLSTRRATKGLVKCFFNFLK
jgi:hypothetical protein